MKKQLGILSDFAKKVNEDIFTINNGGCGLFAKVVLEAFDGEFDVYVVTYNVWGLVAHMRHRDISQFKHIILRHKKTQEFYDSDGWYPKDYFCIFEPEELKIATTDELSKKLEVHGGEPVAQITKDHLTNMLQEDLWNDRFIDDVDAMGRLLMYGDEYLKLGALSHDLNLINSGIPVEG